MRISCIITQRKSGGDDKYWDEEQKKLPMCFGHEKQLGVRVRR